MTAELLLASAIAQRHVCRDLFAERIEGESKQARIKNAPASQPHVQAHILTDLRTLVLWAQRSSSSDAPKNFIYLTISVPDVPKSDMKLDLKPTSVTFTGTSGTLKRKYHVELDFFAEVDPAESKINHTAKNIEMKLQKKELNEEYWPRLLKDSKRLHFLKTDFDKWVDEDEQNEAPEEDFSQFGGMGGMPGMGGT